MKEVAFTNIDSIFVTLDMFQSLSDWYGNRIDGNLDFVKI